MYLFSFIIDYEILTDIREIYNPNWSRTYAKVFGENYEKTSYLQAI